MINVLLIKAIFLIAACQGIETNSDGVAVCVTKEEPAPIVETRPAPDKTRESEQ